MERNRNENARIDKAYEQLTGRKPKVRKKKKAGKGLLITFILLVIVAIIGAGGYYYLLETTRILPGVRAAGVDLSGMTRSEAAKALQDSVGTDYRQNNMTVSVYDETIVLSPSVSNASLNARRAATVAVRYGHDIFGRENAQGRLINAASGVDADISHCLNLNRDAISQKLDKLAVDFGTPLKQTAYEVVKAEDGITIAKIVITKGTPEYQLNLDVLMCQILQAYSMRQFAVVADCSKIEPDEFDLHALYEQYVTKPVAASMDPVTYAVIPEQNGYGFDLDKAKADFEASEAGETVELVFTTISADTTGNDLTEKLNRDVLGEFTVKDLGSDEVKKNLKIACEKINGLVLNPGTVFSLNTRLEQPTAKAGYTKAPSDKDGTMVMGGGLSRLASAMYYCLLSSDLEVLQRQANVNVKSYIDAGFDAYVQWGDADLRFKNSSPYPITLVTEYSGTALTVKITGTKETTDTVTLEAVTTSTTAPQKTYTVMKAKNEFGYKNGSVITKGVAGCTVEVYRVLTPEGSETPTERKLLCTSVYEKIDSEICKIK